MMCVFQMYAESSKDLDSKPFSRGGAPSMRFALPPTLCLPSPPVLPSRIGLVLGTMGGSLEHPLRCSESVRDVSCACWQSRMGHV